MVYAENKGRLESCVFVKSFGGELTRTKKDIPPVILSEENSCNEMVPMDYSTEQRRSNFKLPRLARKCFHDNDGETNLQFLLSGYRCFRGTSNLPEEMLESSPSCKSSTESSEAKYLVTCTSRASLVEDDCLKSASALEALEETENTNIGLVPFTASVLEGQKASLNIKTGSDVKPKKDSSSSLPECSYSKRILLTRETASKSTAATSRLDDLPLKQLKSQIDTSPTITDGCHKSGLESLREKPNNSSNSLNTKLDSRAVFRLPRVDCYELTAENIIHSDACSILPSKKRRRRLRPGQLSSHNINDWQPKGEALKMRHSVYEKIAKHYVTFGEVSSVEGIKMNAKDADHPTLQVLKAVEECNTNPPEIREVTQVKKFVIKLPPIS